MTRRLAATKGLLVGISSGAALAGALKLLGSVKPASDVSRSEPAIVVMIFPDGGERYLSERFWSEAALMAVTLGARSARGDPRARPRDLSATNAAARCIGRDGVVVEAFALPNTTEEGPRRRFLVRPSDYRAPKRARRRRAASCSGSITRIPDHPAQPSQYDLDHAWPFFSYVIVSVREGEPRRAQVLAPSRAIASTFDEEERRRCLSKIHIPTPLRPYTDKLDVVELDGATIGELLANLTTRFGGLKQHLFNEEGRLRSFVNVYVNDEDIRYLQKDQTPLKTGDTVSIIPSVAGGAPTACGSRRDRASRAADCRRCRATRSGATAVT